MARVVRAPMLLLLLLTVAATSLAIAPGALATQRFASPTGSATGKCAPPDPPSMLQRAVEDPQTVNGDEVIVAPGDYMEGANTVVVGTSISLHGADGQAYPRIVSTASGDAVQVQSAATAAVVRRLAIEATNNDALRLSA